MEDDDILLLLLLAEDNVYLKYKQLCLKRRFGIHPINQRRKQFGEFHHLYTQLRRDKERFFKYTRMSINTFDTLLHKIQDHLTYKIHVGKRSISPAEKLIVTLRFLITGNSYRSIAFSFRMGKTTISTIVSSTCKTIWKILQPEYMPVPTEEHLRQVVDDYFRRWNFPNCFGSLDGKHCQFRSPPHSGSTYFNYLKYFSIVLQGVADADKKFITIDVGGYGRQHDASTFRSSTLFSKLQNGEFNAPVRMKIPSTNIELPTFLIADEAYPLSSYLMRPYSGRNLTGIKDLFNKRLSRARKCIECAFGILTRKFGIFAKSIETKEETARDIIKCACILHNLIRTHDGESDLDFRFMVQETYGDVNLAPSTVHYAGRMNNPSRQAKHIRDTLAEYFQTH